MTTTDSGFEYPEAELHEFLPGQVWEAPSGTLYRVTNEQGEWPFYDKCRVVVLRNGATGKRGRKLIKAFNDIDSWHLVKPSQMPTNDPSLPWNKL